MATKTEPRNLAFMVTPMQPVILMSLNPPEKDYLYLSMISFFFFILLAIPALLFSIKVGTIWLSPTPLVPRYSSSVPSHPPYLPRDLFMFLLENLLPPSPSSCPCSSPGPPYLLLFLTREANFHGDQRKAQINSRLALGFSISSILVGSIMIISSIIVGVLKHEV
ncbi:uncharacterized protein AAEQ78_026436 [Lycaon pictus]